MERENEERKDKRAKRRKEREDEKRRERKEREKKEKEKEETFAPRYLLAKAPPPGRAKRGPSMSLNLNI